MTEAGEPISSAPPKADPESLALRASPRPVVRFRRGLMIGIAALGSASIVAVTWFALQPAGLRLAAKSDELYSSDRKAPPDAVARLPGTYAELQPDVPKLGPPLPGDLGRPILERQRELDAMAAEPAAALSPAQEAREAERQRLETERQRLEAERRAVREAGVLAQLSGPGRISGAGAAAGTTALPGPDGDATQAADPSSTSGNARPAMLSRQSNAAASEHRLQPPMSPWQISAGTIIPASLVTGLNSDLPGLAIAQVTQNVSDSATGRTVLVPQGSRLIGRYDHVVAFGQRRALLVWERLVLPDGASLQLDNLPASDAAGHAGLEDRVNVHSGRLLKGIALSTLLGVGSELSLGSSESDLVRALRESGQRSGADAGQQLTSKNLAIQPTITVRPGWPLRVVVHKDLVLRPWRD